jgi:hypothetical protein
VDKDFSLVKNTLITFSLVQIKSRKKLKFCAAESFGVVHAAKPKRLNVIRLCLDPKIAGCWLLEVGGPFFVLPSQLSFLPCVVVGGFASDMSGRSSRSAVSGGSQNAPPEFDRGWTTDGVATAVLPGKRKPPVRVHVCAAVSVCCWGPLYCLLPYPCMHLPYQPLPLPLSVSFCFRCLHCH